MSESEAEEAAQKRYDEQLVISLDDYPEAICQCGHCCCIDCKCSENPDPVKGMMVCPCKTCKDSKKTHTPDHYSNPRRIYPKNKHLASQEVVKHRESFPPRYV